MEDERRLESELDLYDKWVKPESRTNVDYIWNAKEKVFEEITLPFLNSITRDITTSNLDDFEKQRCFYLLVLVSNCIRDFVVYNHNTKDDVLWFSAILGGHAALSKGTQAALVRILKTQYNVSQETKSDNSFKVDENAFDSKEPNLIDTARERMQRGVRRMQ